jgi:hypothetical protein
VCAYISNLRDEVRQKYGISFEGHLEELGKIRDRGKKDNRNLAAAATTEIARGKVAGYYIDQKIVRHGKIDDLNLDQLYERMKTIKEKNEKVLEAKKLLNSTEESESEHKTANKKNYHHRHKNNLIRIPHLNYLFFFFLALAFFFLTLSFFLFLWHIIIFLLHTLYFSSLNQSRSPQTRIIKHLTSPS